MIYYEETNWSYNECSNECNNECNSNKCNSEWNSEWDHFEDIEKFEYPIQYIMVNSQIMVPIYLLIKDLRIEKQEKIIEINRKWNEDFKNSSTKQIAYQEKRDNEIEEWSKTQLLNSYIIDIKEIDDIDCIKQNALIGYFNKIIKFIYTIYVI